MKKFLPILSFLIFFFLLINLQSQEQKATMVITSESVIEVPSIASQIATGTFIQAENIVKEFNPKRWGKNTAVAGKGLPSGKDPLWDKQNKVKKLPGRETILDFEAASSSSTPTDPTGAVGPNHFLNSWNSSFRIWDKSGNPLISAASLSTIFPGTLGDPIVMYDPYADRFFISEFYSNGFDVAVSQGPDPVNDGWYVYRFATNTFPDYPKFSIWSDGYYITANKDQGSASSSEVVFVLERDQMINGNAAQMIGFPLTNIVTSGFYSPLGFNCNGSTLPPAGDAPIVYMQDDSWSGVSTDHLKIWTVDVNWTTPGNSTISSPQIINTAPFDGLFDNGSFSNLPQPSGSDIDALQATIMYMAQYRRFSTYNSVVFNYVVDLDGNDNLAGIRWYELRQDNDGDPWAIHQEGTYSQPDGHSAFCGNMCMDAAGNIALAYTIVSTTQFPSLRYTGRYVNDPSGVMTIAEDVIVNGTQSDPSSRYGDYSQMTIDPVDDVTFWSIGEYFNGGRKNHVGVFQLTPPALTAQFSGSPTNICTNGDVNFTDNSLGSPTSWVWTFEGGTPNTHTGQSPPPINYDTPGTYDVTLEVGDGSTTNSLTLADYISVQNIFSDFSANQTTLFEGSSVTFTDQSLCSPTSWEWTFEGGTPSTYSGETPPSITYNTAGSYDVSLTITNSNGTDTEIKTDYINVLTCVPCETSYSNQDDDWISNVNFNTIDNTTTAEPGGYGNYLNLSTNVTENQTYTLSVSVTVNGDWTQHVWAWIDWNNNCDFTDTGEAYDLGQTSGSSGTETLTIDITVPTGLTAISKIMRVSERYGSDPEPCTETTYGEAEDYSLSISTSSPPVADFSGTPLSGSAPLSVTFTDASSGTITSYAWNFGDGGTSTLQNPTYIYNTPGTYDVSLTVTGPGGSDTETKASYITVAVPAPVADFEADDLTPVTGQDVNFSDLSSNSPTSWTWIFTPNTVTYIGGTNATSQNPQVQFNATGDYTVELTATNVSGSDTETKANYITVALPAPVADFSADNTTPETNETVSFSDISSNTPTSWIWVFTPNTITFMNGTTASSQNPEVRFDAEGLYDVQLTATNATGSDIELKTNYINCTNVAPPPDANFVADNLNPTIEETVNFTDLSTNNPTSWAWSFSPSTIAYMGGTDASSQHPQVRFDAPGSYDVALIATNVVGSDTETKTNYIIATDPPPVADFEADNITPLTNETVNFTDLSTNTPTSWSWSFSPSTITYMNGTNLNSQHPEVRFDIAGTYTVELTAINDGGSDTEIKSSYITASDPIPPPVAEFSADNLNPTIEETVNFTDLSTNTPTSWIWVFTPNTISFMNGTTASSQNPKVRFDDLGAYTVELTATNAGGSDIETKVNYINATIPPPVADFVADNTTPNVGETVSFTDLSTNNPTSWNWVLTPSNFIFVNATNQNSQHPLVQFITNGLYTVELTAINDGGADTETKTAYINAGDVFEVIATATPNVICLGQSSLLQAFPSGGSGNYTFYWTSDPSGFFSNNQNVMVYPEENTLYNIEVDDGVQNISADVFVTVNPIPIITLGEWPEQLCNQNEPPIQLTALPEGGVYSGDAVSSNGIFSPELAPLGWNVITYTYTDDLGCSNSDQDSIYVDECVGIYELSIDNAQVDLYPNPNSGEFIIASSHNITRIEIVNQMGKLVSSEKYEAKSVRFNIILPKGLYYVRTFVTDKNNKIGLINKELMIQ